MALPCSEAKQVLCFSCFSNFPTRTHWLTSWLTSLPSSKVWILSQLEHCTIIVGCFVLLGLAPCKEEVFLYRPLQAGSESTLKPIHSIVKMHNLIALKSISTVWYKAQFEPLLIFFSFITTAKCMQIFITHLFEHCSGWKVSKKFLVDRCAERSSCRQSQSTRPVLIHFNTII